MRSPRVSQLNSTYTLASVNLDRRETGVRHCSRLAEDKLDPYGALLERLYHPKVIRLLDFGKELCALTTQSFARQC